MNTKINNGGPAFPIGSGDMRDPVGMSLREYFAAHAPVDFSMAVAVWGDDHPAMHNDCTRAAFFAVWAMLCYEYADAMLAIREGPQ